MQISSPPFRIPLYRILRRAFAEGRSPAHRVRLGHDRVGTERVSRRGGNARKSILSAKSSWWIRCARRPATVCWWIRRPICASAGTSMEEIEKWLLENRQKVHHQFFSTDLTHYRRSGRMSGAAAMLGAILNICPIMRLDDAGRIIAYDKVRQQKERDSRNISHDGGARTGRHGLRRQMLHLPLAMPEESRRRATRSASLSEARRQGAHIRYRNDHHQPLRPGNGGGVLPRRRAHAGRQHEEMIAPHFFDSIAGYFEFPGIYNP